LILPPGTLLQQMYFRERLRALPHGRFIEVGAGQGIASKTLLDLGWSGRAYELNRDALAAAAELNQAALSEGRYQLEQRDWLEAVDTESVDLVASCMVLEHLADADEARYLERCRKVLKRGGAGVLFVPGCPDYWGIEDEIAGHLRRYTFDSLRQSIEARGLRVRHMAGLTYPLSNLLFPLSEFLVRRAESAKLALSPAERTRLSGNRDVPLKTHFPPPLRLVLNEWVLSPLHWLQKLNVRNPRSLVIYAEFEGGTA
jgi:2-polyprenyl-3-methyl-5-hydroxy-6-metoxy-1,4-benzoquinol methylase